MKIFYKKDFQRVLEEKKKLEKEFEKFKKDIEINIIDAENRNFKLLQEKSSLQDKLFKGETKSQEEINSLKIKLSLVKEDLKKANTSKGGYVRENNKLKKQAETDAEEKQLLLDQIKELEKKLKESMTGKYRVKTIPSGRTPNTQKTKISPQMKPQVQKFMKENSND